MIKVHGGALENYKQRTILHLLRNMVGEWRIGNMGSDNQAFFIGSLKIKRGD